MDESIILILNAVQLYCERNGIVFDYDPNKISYDLEFSERRQKILKMENRFYLNYYKNKDDNLIISIKKFILWDDTIDEEDTYWIDERDICKIVVKSEYTPDDVIAQIVATNWSEFNLQH